MVLLEGLFTAFENVKESTSCLRRFQESVSGVYSGLRADSAAAARSAAVE